MVEKVIARLAQVLQAVDAELPLAQVQKASEQEEPNLYPLFVALDIIESLHECSPKSFMLLIKVAELPIKKLVEGIMLKTQQIIYMMGRRCQNMCALSDEETLDEVEVTCPLPQVTMVSSDHSNPREVCRHGRRDPKVREDLQDGVFHK